MVQMLFYLRFRSQLRRTNALLVSQLEETVTKAVAAAGGSLIGSRKFFTVAFNMERIGFWLDILILLEKIEGALRKNRHALSGYALVLRHDDNSMPEVSDAENLCLTLSSGSVAVNSGIWCSSTVQEAMQYYCVFNKAVRGYAELKSFVSFRQTGKDFYFPNRETIMQNLEIGEENTLLLGRQFIGKRDAVYHYCAAQTGEIPPIMIRFVPGSPAAMCFADTLTPQLNMLLNASEHKTANEEPHTELNAIAELLFRERLRDPISPFIVTEIKRYLALLLKNYSALIKGKCSKAVIILEGPLTADENTFGIFWDAFSSLENKNDFFIFGIDSCSADNSIREWKNIFPKVLDFSDDNFALPAATSLSPDLWETAYLLSVFGHYFPSALFPQLLEEEGINPQGLGKALELLSHLGTIDTVLDPAPRIPDFISRAERVLRSRKEKIKDMLKNRLFAWELSGRLHPCFNLLKILSDLGGKASGALVLRCLRGDIFDSATDRISALLNQKNFKQFIGIENSDVLGWIFRTWHALGSVKANDIRKAFSEPPPVYHTDVYKGYKAQIHANMSSYWLGMRNTNAASEMIKELMHLNQNLKDGGIPSYRYFSILTLFRQRQNDALDYSSFALDLAEKSGQKEESLKASYFGASINLLCGNLFKADELIQKAIKIAAESGWALWAARCYFFLGRLRFEAGRYKEARAIFESLNGRVPSGAGEETLASWIFRTSIYILITSSKVSNDEIVLPMFSNVDGRLFAAEAAYLLGNYEKAVNLCDIYMQDPGNSDNDFIFTEQPDWQSGFSQCEYLLNPPSVFFNRAFNVYKLLSQSCLPNSESGVKIQEKMRQMIREELFPDNDTNSIFYLYAHYLILRATGASIGDISTAISMAYKRFQRRAERIDDVETRQGYISQNYWNSGLSLAAREYKLI